MTARAESCANRNDYVTALRTAVVQGQAPIAAVLILEAFFLSVASPTATQPNGLLKLAYVGAVFWRRSAHAWRGAHSLGEAHGAMSQPALPSTSAMGDFRGD